MARASSGVGFRLFLPTRIVAIPSYRGNRAISYSADSVCPNHASTALILNSKPMLARTGHVHIQRVVLKTIATVRAAEPSGRPATAAWRTRAAGSPCDYLVDICHAEVVPEAERKY